MTHLLSSKGFHYRHNTVSQSHAAVLRRATQNPRTSYFFSLPTSSVSRLAVAPVPKAKRGLFLASDLNQGDIVAAPWQCSDEPGVEQYFLGEVGSVNRSERKLSVTFLTDNVPSDYSWDDPETGKILRVNDAKTGSLFKTCGPRVVGRRLFFRSAADNPEQQYLPATITGFDAETQQHQLQLHPDQTEPPPSSAPSEPPISADLSKADVRLARPTAADVPATATVEIPSPLTLTLRTTRAAAARSDAQTPVHTHFAHTDNINITLGRPASTPIKGKRFTLSTNDLPSPASVKRKTGVATTAKKPTFSSNTKGNPTSDALLLAFEDPAPAPITSPFSADSPHALAFDHKLTAELPGSLSAPRAIVVSSPFGSTPLLFPDSVHDVGVALNDNADEAFLDALMTELASKRSLLSSRSTDAKSSETPVADDVSPSPVRSSKRNKKIKREL